MVAVIAKSGNSIYGVLAYNMKKTETHSSEIIAGQGIIFKPGNYKENIDSIIESFKPYLEANNRTKYPVFHCSLNPHPQDQISNSQLGIIADEYMQEMGYGNQPYVVFKHTDNYRSHIHIVSVRVDRMGKKLPHYKEGEKSVRICEKIEEKYGLIKTKGHSNPQPIHGLHKVDYTRGDLKKQIKDVLLPILKTWNFQSYGELNKILNNYNVWVEHVKGEIKGIPFEGVVYGALDEYDNKVGPPFKSSILGRDFSAGVLANKFSKGCEIFKKSQPRIQQIKSVFNNVMDTRPQYDILLQELKKIGATIMINSNENRITGVTFIDLQNHMLFNGSRLGKQYSANVLNSKLEGFSVTQSALVNPEELINFRADFQTGDNSNIPSNTGSEVFSLNQRPASVDKEFKEREFSSRPRDQGDKETKTNPSNLRPSYYEEFEEYHYKKRKKGRNV